MRSFSNNKEPDTLSDPVESIDLAQGSPNAVLTHEQCINALSERLKSNGMNDLELEIQVRLLSDTAKSLNSTVPFDVITAQIEKESFRDLPQTTKDQFLSLKKSLTPVEPEQKASGVDVKPADAVLDEKDAQAAFLAKKVNAPQEDLHAQLQQQNMVPITLGGAMAMGIGRLVKRICDGKESGPGKSFTDLQAAGDGLGMNNPNMDAAVLAEKSLVRSKTAADNLAELKAGATPEEIAKAKKGVIDAAEDAQLYLGNKHRSDIAEVASGKKTQFDAKDEISAGSDRLQKSFDTAKNADVAIGDDSFQEAIKTHAEKAKEMVKQLMDSLKEIASKLFGAGVDNDNDNKKTAAPKPAGPR